MTDRATMRRARRGNGPQDTRTLHPQGSVPTLPQGARPFSTPQGARPFSSRVRAVMTQPQIPVTPAQSPVPRTGLRPNADPVIAAVQQGFAGLQASLDGLTRAIRQGSGLDEADEELEALRHANRELQDRLHDALQTLEAAGVQVNAPEAPSSDPEPAPVPEDQVEAPSPVAPAPDVPA